MTLIRPGGAPIYFVTFCEKTSFFKLQDIFPECFLNREPVPDVEPLICVREDSCPTNHNCMETLAKRVHILFEEVLPGSKMIVLYFKKRNIPGIGGCIFWRTMAEPRVITVNPFAWNKVKQRGTVYEFSPGPSFFLTGRAAEPQPTEKESAQAALE